MIAPLLTWSVLMAPPTAPLTEAQKKAEYEMVKVKEVLTPEQIEKRDIIPGWRPIPPLSDIEQEAEEIVPGEENPYATLGEGPVGAHGLSAAELATLGEPSPSPPSLRARARAAYWYEQVDAQGEATGLRLVVYGVYGAVHGLVLMSLPFMRGVEQGTRRYSRTLRRGAEAATEATRALARRLSGTAAEADPSASARAQMQSAMAAMFTSMQVWSPSMASPPGAPAGPLTAAREAAEYARVRVDEVLTAAQIERRDVVPGWRPIPPRSDIERGAMQIVPGQANPFLIYATVRVDGRGLLPEALAQLGAPSPSPTGFRAYTGAAESYWYEQIDAKGEMTGIWMAVYPRGESVEGLAMVGQTFMSPNALRDIEIGITACRGALRALERTLSGAAR